MAWSSLYRTKRWWKIRAAQLKNHPLCKICLSAGRVTKATVCDHVEPHRGDEQKFWAGPFQSLCQTCHSSWKQRFETNGRAPTITGIDGWPRGGG